MEKLPLNLNVIRAARQMRAGDSPLKVASEYGLSSRKIERIRNFYDAVPDNLLAGIERVLSDREKLRHLVSNLVRKIEVAND